MREVYPQGWLCSAYTALRLGTHTPSQAAEGKMSHCSFLALTYLGQE